jgi:tetratricopeptide (TPR) repeat protein
MRRMIVVLALLTVPLFAQEHRNFNFVAPNTTGRIIVPPGPNWTASSLALYDKGTRPVIAYKDSKTNVVLSFILFANDTAGPTAESCRDAVIDPILQDLHSTSTVQNEKRDSRVLSGGTHLATASYLVAKMKDVPVEQENVFGFYGDSNTCAEVHLSKANFKPEDFKLLDDALSRFAFDTAYVPDSLDFGTMATLFYGGVKDYRSAAVYYQRALDTVPNPEPKPNYRRMITDQLSMSYGMYGDTRRSRAVNEAAIQRDPDYPLYYYNLACADAEENDTPATHAHLQQAFDRSANALPGEPLPDPATDNSFQKWKNDKKFWTFVQTLSAKTKQ